MGIVKNNLAVAVDNLVVAVRLIILAAVAEAKADAISSVVTPVFVPPTARGLRSISFSDRFRRKFSLQYL